MIQCNPFRIYLSLNFAFEIRTWVELEFAFIHFLVRPSSAKDTKTGAKMERTCRAREIPSRIEVILAKEVG